LAILDSAGVPIVGGVDVLLVAIAVVSPAQAYLAAGCALVGSMAGSLILFLIARKGGQVILAKYTESGRGRALRYWFERYGLVTVFVPAISLLPMPMKIPVFCAAVLEVRLSAFLAVVFSARVVRYFALAYLAQRYGKIILTREYLKEHWLGMTLAIVALTVLMVVVLRRLGKPPATPDAAGSATPA
jgi:membrane protein YqaA with SNARE-associated domain